MDVLGGEGGEDGKSWGRCEGTTERILKETRREEKCEMLFEGSMLAKIDMKCSIDVESK